MKKLLLLIALLLGVFTQAQNIELLHQANKGSLEFARKFSDEIVSSAKTKFTYFDSVDSKHLGTTTLIYIKDGLNDVEKKSVEAYIYRYKITGRYKFRNENCMSFDFKFSNNEYSFDVVEGSFLDLFPFYQKNIEPTATTEKVTGTYSVRKDTDGYWYNFIRSDGYWYLKNMSYRL